MTAASLSATVSPGPCDDTTVVGAGKAALLLFYDPTDGRASRVEGCLAQVLQRRRNHDAVAVRRVDVRAHADLVGRFGINTTPALVVEAPYGCKAIAALLQPWLR